MKRPLRLIDGLSAFLLAAACGACGGSPSPHRNEWRHPPAVCTNDDQCMGGACVMEDGATQGTCRGGSLAPLPPGPGGRPPAGPAHEGPPPSIQPGPGDIQL